MYSQKSNIVVVGAGKVAYSITSALLKSGYNVSAIVSRKLKSAKNLAEKFKIKNISDEISSVSEGKIFFLTLPDSEIKKVSVELSKKEKNLVGKLFIHLSGSENISALNSLKRKKADTASMHIMQTFPSKRIVKIKNCFAALEYENKKTEKYLLKLTRDLGLIPFNISPDKKVYYHLAGVFTSNFLTGNFFASEKLLDKTRVKVNHQELLYPTAKKTLENILNFGSAKALSGPVERGEIKTVINHISALKKKENKSEFLFLLLHLNYLIQSLMLTETVKEKKGKKSQEDLEIREILKQELKKIIEKL